jgi:hypothetical protein
MPIPSMSVAIRPPAQTPVPVLDWASVPPSHLAMLVIDGDAGAAAGHLAALRARAPWLPCCVVCPGHVPGRRPHWPQHPVIRHDPALSDAALARRAIAAIEGRPAPTVPELARWLADRLRRPTWLADLTLALSAPEPVECHAAGRALRRRLGGMSPLARHEWRRLAMLARLPRQGSGVDGLALRAGMNVGYFRAWTRRLLGLSAAKYRHLPGWEPVLELALRHAGVAAAADWGPVPGRRNAHPAWGGRSFRMEADLASAPAAAFSTGSSGAAPIHRGSGHRSGR